MQDLFCTKFCLCVHCNLPFILGMCQIWGWMQQLKSFASNNWIGFWNECIHKTSSLRTTAKCIGNGVQPYSQSTAFESSVSCLLNKHIFTVHCCDTCCVTFGTHERSESAFTAFEYKKRSRKKIWHIPNYQWPNEIQTPEIVAWLRYQMSAVVHNAVNSQSSLHSNRSST